MEVSIIIPAFNEEKNISRVLEPLSTIREPYEILVVNDGSTDRTSDIVYSFGMQVLDLPKNMGKSYAMKAGLNNTSGEAILYLDADLIGLRPQHIQWLISPVKEDLADMTLGVFCSGRGITDLAQKLTPFLSGQRVVRRESLFCLREQDWESGFGIEVALTRYAKEHHLRILEIPLENVSQTMKEEKLGLAKGMEARLKMYWEIARALNRK
ncbi:MAG: glycosyltransferase family 2 protein [Clostridiales bacterium]|jgi:glycosyltransferase involved in cell wall biosynthesis|nr:glycosyltransferase family 2 protein [Clostridiales bacterium]